MKFIVFVFFLRFIFGSLITEETSSSVVSSSPSTFAFPFEETEVAEITRIKQALLEKYLKVYPSSEAGDNVDYSKVEVIGWPKQGFFYESFLTNKAHRRAVLKALDKIEMVRDFRRFDAIRKQEALELWSRLHSHFRDLFCQIPWDTKIKADFPNFKLSARNPNFWDAKDVFLVRKIISEYEGDDTEVQKLHHLERALETEAELLKKCIESTGLGFSEIDWKLVEVSGWPQGVLFCKRIYWDPLDVILLNSSMNQISFKRKYQPIARLKFDSNYLRSIFMSRFMVGNEIDWSAVMVAFPGLHLTSLDPKKWINSDYFQLQDGLINEPSILGKRFAEEKLN